MLGKTFTICDSGVHSLDVYLIFDRAPFARKSPKGVTSRVREFGGRGLTDLCTDHGLRLALESVPSQSVPIAGVKNDPAKSSPLKVGDPELSVNRRLFFYDTVTEVMSFVTKVFSLSVTKHGEEGGSVEMSRNGR